MGHRLRPVPALDSSIAAPSLSTHTLTASRRRRLYFSCMFTGYLSAFTALWWLSISVHCTLVAIKQLFIASHIDCKKLTKKPENMWLSYLSILDGYCK